MARVSLNKTLGLSEPSAGDQKIIELFSLIFSSAEQDFDITNVMMLRLFH